MTGDLWQCTNKRGGYCTAPVWCDTFNGDDYASYNYDDYNFKFNFTSNSSMYFRVPLMALMRNDKSQSNPTCQLLIYQLNSANTYSEQIIVGDAILQQFFAEMSYNGNGVGTNNTLTLTATPYSLPTAYVGNVEYPTYINIPSNSSSASNSSDDVVPAVTPATPAKYTNLEKVEMYAAGAIGIIFIILLILIVVICCTSGMSAFSSTAALTGSNTSRDSNVYKTNKEEDAEDMIYQMDRNTLMKEARAKTYY
jgi:Na+-transporting methylmalonyl-CoA/oxaloacetate decarboxylase gamma subunit